MILAQTHEQGPRRRTFPLGGRISFYEANRRLAEMLKAKGVKLTYRETEGAHVWSLWRNNLYESAPLLFRAPLMWRPEMADPERIKWSLCMNRKRALSILAAALFAASFLAAQQPNARRDPTQSPASAPHPKTTTPQSYSPEQIQAGQQRFAAECGFCHGRDAAGGETGPDLTRSELVAQDVRGDEIALLLRVGRVDAGMPSFSLSASDADAIVAFLHNQMDKFATLAGGRRTVDPEDLATGNAADGEAYFKGVGGCSQCHSPTGDLAHIASRYKGLALLERMLYPGGRPAPAPPKAIFTLDSGLTVVAPLVAQDEFSVTVLDPLGARQTYQRTAVKVKIDDPLSAHFTQLGKYTDADMHNLFAYLDTLK